MKNPPEHSEEVGENGQDRQSRDRGKQARQDQFSNRIGAESAHGVDLLADQHRSDFGSNSGADAPGDHQCGQNRTELTDHRERDHLPQNADLAEGAQGPVGLQSQHAAREKTRQQHDGQGPYADHVHLEQGVNDVPGRGKDAAEGNYQEKGEILDGQHPALHKPHLRGAERHSALPSEESTLRRTKVTVATRGEEVKRQGRARMTRP